MKKNPSRLYVLVFLCLYGKKPFVCSFVLYPNCDWG